jgi:DNA-binding MarR family transcriptional regulator
MLSRGSLSLTKIGALTGKDNGYILSHIKKMEIAGAVQTYIKRTEDTREYSVYKITPFCETILTNVIDAYTSYLEDIVLQDYGSLLNSPTCGQVRNFFDSISNTFRITLVYYLIDKNELSFSQIVTLSKKTKSSVANHLKKLELAGIIQNFLKKSENSPDYSFYRISSSGEILLKKLVKVYNFFFKLEEIGFGRESKLNG